MTAASQSVPNPPRAKGQDAATSSDGEARGNESRLAFRSALARYRGQRLTAIRLAQGSAADDGAIRPTASAEEIADFLDRPAAVRGLVGRLEGGSRLALAILALTESVSVSLAGLSHMLGILGVDPVMAITRLLELGLLAVEPNQELGGFDDFAQVFRYADGFKIRLRAHPTVIQGVRTERPEGPPPKSERGVRQVRESDALEAILRLGALWQRVGIEPLRQTHQGTLYKRDRDRLAEDPVLSCPIADAITPLAQLPDLWLALAHHVALVERDSAGERISAAPAEFWTDNAVHLPQMIALGWMGLTHWQEIEPKTNEERAALALPFLRVALLLWLAALEEGEWVALEDMASTLAERWPRWDRLSFANVPAADAARKTSGGRARSRSRGDADSPPRGVAVLEAVLLGAAYPLGLVRAAEEEASGRRVVQLAPLARYALALGPAPPPRDTFEQFLFVQPNFEVIAYRQGLTPQLGGRLSQIAWWSQIGTALELKLTRESIVHGLDGGLTAESMLETLTKHSQRALPAGITDAITNWSTRRERVTYYAAATLIEFSQVGDRDLAIAFWPAGAPGTPIPVGERFLLVEDEKTVPFDRLRLISSRDYRRTPEACAIVQADGVTMALDPARSDLLVEAELARFADFVPAPVGQRDQSASQGRRHFRVSSATLQRGMGRGLTVAQLGEWYTRRTGADVPPAVRLLLAAKTSRVPALKVARLLVVNLPTTELLDGLLQHPATAPYFTSRLGPTSAVIAEEKLTALQIALNELGIELKS